MIISQHKRGIRKPLHEYVDFTAPLSAKELPLKSPNSIIISRHSIVGDHKGAMDLPVRKHSHKAGKFGPAKSIFGRAKKRRLVRKKGAKGIAYQSIGLPMGKHDVKNPQLCRCGGCYRRNND